jgi:hypothetical protein
MPAIRLNANDIGRVIGGVPRRCLTISNTNAAHTITTETTHAYIRFMRVPLQARGSIVVSAYLREWSTPLNLRFAGASPQQRKALLDGLRRAQ